MVGALVLFCYYESNTYFLPLQADAEDGESRPVVTGITGLDRGGVCACVRACVRVCVCT